MQYLFLPRKDCNFSICSGSFQKRKSPRSNDAARACCCLNQSGLRLADHDCNIDVLSRMASQGRRVHCCSSSFRLVRANDLLCGCWSSVNHSQKALFPSTMTMVIRGPPDLRLTVSPGLNCSSAILIVPGLRCRGPDNTKEHRLASAGSFVSDEHAFVYRVGANRLKVVSKHLKRISQNFYVCEKVACTCLSRSLRACLRQVDRYNTPPFSAKGGERRRDSHGRKVYTPCLVTHPCRGRIDHGGHCCSRPHRIGECAAYA